MISALHFWIVEDTSKDTEGKESTQEAVGLSKAPSEEEEEKEKEGEEEEEEKQRPWRVQTVLQKWFYLKQIIIIIIIIHDKRFT